MWKLTGHPKTQIATRPLAEQFQRMEPAIQDRPVSELRLKVYEKIMRAGGFRPMSWAAAHCKETDEETLLREQIGELERQLIAKRARLAWITQQHIDGEGSNQYADAMHDEMLAAGM